MNPIILLPLQIMNSLAVFHEDNAKMKIEIINVKINNINCTKPCA